MEQCHGNQDFLWMSRDAGSLHAGPMPLQRHLWIHNDSIASQVTWLTACFLSLFGYPLACDLFYVLIAYFSLYLKRLFLSRILVYLFSFVVSLFAPNCRSISFRSPILCFFVSCRYFYLFMCIFLGLWFLLHILFLHFSHLLSYHLLQSGQLSEYSDWPAGWTTNECIRFPVTVHVCLSSRPDPLRSLPSCDPTGTECSSLIVKAVGARH